MRPVHVFRLSIAILLSVQLVQTGESPLLDSVAAASRPAALLGG